jgi:hypothetical protein
MARLQNKKQAAVTTKVQPLIRHSLPNGFTAYSALSLETGHSCSHREQIYSLDTSLGVSGPHAFAVRLSTVRPRENSRALPKRPSHPASRVVTIAIRPSCRSRTAGECS